MKSYEEKVFNILNSIYSILGIIYKPILIKADSGFDSSYDSGGSSSGSSSSSSNWNFSSSSSDNNISILTIVPVIIFITFIILLCIFKSSKSYKLIFTIFLVTFFVIFPLIITIIILSSLLSLPKTNIIAILISILVILTISIIVIKKLIKTAKESINEIIKTSNLLKLTNGEIQNKLPDLNIEEFNKIVFNNYKDIQDAWMNFDLDAIKNLVSDEIYNMYSMQLDTLKVKGQKNMMENINFIDNYICDINIENNTTTISTILSVTCYDYIVDSNNKVIRGNKNLKLYYTYRLTFTKNNKTINTCPNCGTTIDSKKDTKCPYCNATVVNNNSEWIMTKKEMLKQTTK